MFTTFIPTLTFEQGWWAQPCVQAAYIGTQKDKKFTPGHPGTASLSGSNVENYLEACFNQSGGPVTRLKKTTLTRENVSDRKIFPEPRTAASADEERDGDVFLNLKTVRFRNWSPTSFNIFRDLSHMVVAGVHIVDSSQLSAQLDKVTCPADDAGTLKYPEPGKDTLTCTMTGRNLDKISRLRLRKLSDQTDPGVAEAAVSVSGDSTSASAVFKVVDLRNLPAADYAVYSVATTGTERKTNQAIHLDLSPFVSGVEPAPLDISKPGPRLALAGFHLDTVQQLTLKSGDETHELKATLPALQTTHSVVFEIGDKEFGDKLSDKPYSLSVTFTGGQKPLDLMQTVTINRNKAAADKAAAEKAAADKAAADKAATDKAATDKAATDKAATDKAATDKAATDKVAAGAAGKAEGKLSTPAAPRQPGAAGVSASPAKSTGGRSGARPASGKGKPTPASTPPTK